MNTTARSLFSLNLAMATLLFSSEAQASKLKVPKQFQTIRAAVDQAEAGDTIEIEGGTYYERVWIRDHLDGIRLMGKGEVILDCLNNEDGFYWFGLEISADNVHVENITLRHYSGEHIQDPWAVYVAGANVVLDRVKVFHNIVPNGDDVGIYVTGDEARLRNCVVKEARDGITLEGFGTKVSRCRVSVCSHDGIVLGGLDSHEVSKCTISKIGDNAINVRVPFSVIRENEIQNVRTAVMVRAPDTVVRDNRISSIEELGIFAENRDYLSVCGNRIEATQEYGILLETCDDSQVCHNTILNGINDYGLYVEGSSNQVTDNTVRDWGESGIGVRGDQNLLSGNLARGCAKRGFTINGDENHIIDNRAEKNLADGFVVWEGNGNRLEDNTARKNLGEGIDNHGNGTLLIQNRSKKNRIDIANSGNVHLFQGNEYDSGGVGTAGEIN